MDGVSKDRIRRRDAELMQKFHHAACAMLSPHAFDDRIRFRDVGADAERAPELAAAAWFEKPVSVPKVISVLRRLCENR